MKTMVIDDILSSDATNLPNIGNNKYGSLSIIVRYNEPYFRNPKTFGFHEALKDKLFLMSFDREKKLIQSIKGKFIFQLSENAYQRLCSIHDKLTNEGKETILYNKVYNNISNTYQRDDHRGVFFDLKSIQKEEEVKEQIIEAAMDRDSELTTEQENELISQISYKEYAIPDEFFNNKLFFNLNGLSSSKQLHNLEEHIHQYFLKTAGFKPYERLNYIDFANKKLMVAKTKMELLVETIIKEEVLSDNQFIIYMDGRSIESSNENLLKKFVEQNETKFGSMYTICKHANVLFLANKNSDGTITIQGHYTDDNSVLNDVYEFIGQDETQVLLLSNEH